MWGLCSISYDNVVLFSCVCLCLCLNQVGAVYVGILEAPASFYR